MNVFSNTKLRPATVSMFFLALLFSSGCGNNEKRTTAKPSEVDRVKLAPLEQAEADKYIKEHGRDAIMHYLMDGWKKLDKKLDELSKAKTYKGIENNSEALFREAKKLAHVDDRRVLNHIKYFVAQGADVNAKSEFYGTAPLHTATTLRNLEAVQFLVSKGVDVNAEGSDGFTPMTWASIEGHNKIVRFLVSKGADVNARDSYGQTPLRLAVLNGNFETVKLLVSKGADVNAKDKNGHTPLYGAGHPQISEFLISKGAK